MTKVSVVIPCYNREAFLSETLDSLLAQSDVDWQAFVVDDHSDDASFSMAQDYASRDLRIKALRRTKKTKGANACRNEGLEKVDSPYVIFLDSDDTLSDGALSARVHHMDASSSLDFAVYATEVFSEKLGDRQLLWNTFDDNSDLHRFLRLDPVWATAAPIWRTDSIKKLGGFDEDLLSFQDWDVHLRALLADLKYQKLAKVDNCYRQGNASSKAISEVAAKNIRHLKSHAILFERTLARVRHSTFRSEETERRVAGLYWWLSRRWILARQPSSAKNTWQSAFDHGLIDRSRLKIGKVALLIMLLKGGSRIAASLTRKWPREYLEVGSATMHNTPLESLATAKDDRNISANC